MPGDKSVRFGLIGCGDIGLLRARAIRESGHALAAVSDVDPVRMSLIGSDRAARSVDWRELIRRADVDAVIISTAPSLHAAMGTEALQAGKHVLCEKPLARTPEECAMLLDAAAVSDRQLATGFNYRFYPSFRLMREWLDAGRIGDLSHIRAYAGYSAESHAQPWVHDGEITGGGALHDIGIHLLDLVLWYLGDVEEVQGMANARVWGFPGCEDNGVALLRGRAGRMAELHASWTEWGPYQFLVELVGRHGRIRASCFPMRAELLSSDRVGGRKKRTTRRFPRSFLGEHLKTYRWVVTRSFVDELDAFAALIRREPTSIATGPDGARAVDIAHRISRAAVSETAQPA